MNQNNAGFMSSIPVVTRNLIIINFLVWIADMLLGNQLGMGKYLALHYFSSNYFMPHQIITYMFMHGSLGHVFFNMFAVYMFGRTLEMVWGPKRFLIYYMLTGIGAAALQLLITYLRIKGIESSLSPDIVSQIQAGATSVMATASDHDAIQNLYALINTPMVGASGAVFGVLVAFGMLFPNVELMMLFFPVPIKAKWFVIGYGALELILGVMDNAGDNVAHFAHLGGLITGFFIILYWRKKGKANGHNFRQY
ncbi:rhomboid family intramembrane serine protease [Dysgonomonas sp. 521]|uniref:rhomboid family intramembrane serine protease n=1 Tax=Dysgonomonas sp. 521 TaxID=2302932 RepID=UPI0013D47E6E|nr:rhomboid family intramembrane serine protease [Dysgonomonas sp. 521]NDV96194.1 rhomboid family intramembrane serine protease [Dysgonomonas sp. 521]